MDLRDGVDSWRRPLLWLIFLSNAFLSTGNLYSTEAKSSISCLGDLLLGLNTIQQLTVTSCTAFPRDVLS